MASAHVGWRRIIYYNADIFAQEGIEPPSNDPELAWTWDRFVEVATGADKST
jgi:ABC-type glycerol-3-phosphate transport system substrate-binding protein